MKRWILATAGLGFTALALAAQPPADTPEKPPAPKAQAEADQGEGVSLTVYNQNFVIVKDRRLLDLAAGRSTLRLKGVAATIVPETVQFSTLGNREARVVEQNYEFDLVSADKLLDRYIDHPIKLVMQDGETVAGKLLSFDAGQIVLQGETGILLVPRDNNVKDVQLSALPGGLLTKPTLVWQLDSKGSGKELVKVAYRADQMKWEVDYRASLNQAGDRLDLSGWVTLTNQTGTAFKDAQVKLMAGDVNIVQPPPPPVNMPARGGGLRRATAEPAFTEKSFAEYHLYELGRTTTIKDRETKQIELLDVPSIPVTRKYAYRGAGSNAEVLVEFKNEEKTAGGLGIPLPKGPVRVFQRDLDDQPEFSGRDALDHTPKGELVQMRLGYAYDIRGERRIVNQRRPGANISEMDVEVRIRNHKTDPVTVDVIETINGRSEWSMLRHSHPFEKRDVNTLVFPIDVKSNAEVILTYTIRYVF